MFSPQPSQGVAGWRLKPARKGSEQRSASEGNAFPFIFRLIKPIFDIFYTDLSFDNGFF